MDALQIIPVQGRCGVQFWLNEYDTGQPRNPEGPLFDQFAIKRLHGVFETYEMAEAARAARAA